MHFISTRSMMTITISKLVKSYLSMYKNKNKQKCKFDCQQTKLLVIKNVEVKCPNKKNANSVAQLNYYCIKVNNKIRIKNILYS